MMPVSLHIHYCDSIIRHADDFRYSLIGIYPGVCPLPSRDAEIDIIARHQAGFSPMALAEAGITPNSISVASVVFAALGAVCLLVSPVGWGGIACAVGIQLRLLCNLIDGMVAVEGGRKTPTGALYNEVPDRVADSVLLVSLGYAVGGPWLGWLAGLGAPRGSLVLVQSFRGPMAKQHRMALMTGACLLSPLFGTTGLLHLALILMALGALITCGTRLKGIAAQLR